MNTLGSEPAAVGLCLLHADRPGTPCARCGTFRCEACLLAGLCPECRDAAGLSAPKAEDTVGFWPRVGARVIDLFVAQGSGIAGGLLAAVMLMVLERLGLARAQWTERLDLGLCWNLVLGIGASAAGAAVAAWICGASVGKWLLGLRIVTMDGRPLRFGPALVRELAVVIDSIFFGALAWQAMQSTPFNQRLGDQGVGTTVVRRQSLAPARLASLGVLLMGLGLGACVHALVIALGFVVLAR